MLVKAASLPVPLNSTHSISLPKQDTQIDLHKQSNKVRGVTYLWFRIPSEVRLKSKMLFLQEVLAQEATCHLEGVRQPMDFLFFIGVEMRMA